MAECYNEFMENVPDFTELGNETCSECILEKCSPDPEIYEEEEEEEEVEE